MAATVQTRWKEKIYNSVEIPILTRCCFCCPLRKGLITFAYFNLMLTVTVSTMLSIFLAHLRKMDAIDNPHYSRVIVDTSALILELIMTVIFIVALHKKHVLLMRVYLYFEIVFSVVGFTYSVAFLNSESANELFIALFQLMLQVYLSVLIWSSIVKMERDGTVKYVREEGSA